MLRVLRCQQGFRSAASAGLPERLARSAQQGWRRHQFSSRSEERDSMDYDVVIVGAGPAGLGAAIRLKQLDSELSVCVVEKGAEVGSHILSGNVFEPRALDELIPDWKEKQAPVTQVVTKDEMYFLTKTRSFPLPTPPSLHNDGNYIISLGSLCKWLGEQAEELEVEIYPGFAAKEVLYGDDGEVRGIITGDQGVSKDGSQKETFTPGMELRGRQTLLCEGVRGNLSESVIDNFALRKGKDPQTYGLGLKEVWQLAPGKCQPGLVQHTLGWPGDRSRWQGSFLYHVAPDLAYVGLVVGLDYENPWVSPYEEFQLWKQHPLNSELLEGGKCISYGARCINEGGLQSLPKLTFPGGMLAGCSAGFLNVPKIKGSHGALKSGMLAAEAICQQLQEAGEGDNLSGRELVGYEETFKQSWLHKELHEVRNVHPSYKYGFVPFLIYSALEDFFLKGRVPWTLRNRVKDCDRTKLASSQPVIHYPKPDGKISFDLLTNLQRSGTFHEEDQPSHLQIKPDLAHVPLQKSLKDFMGPEQRFCPAKVYEYVEDDTGMRLQINAQNCLHCKTCSIKTPEEFINWTVPEGGGGPAYENM